MGYGATTYGRRTGSSKLRPFPWAEIGSFTEGWSVEERIRAWATACARLYSVLRQNLEQSTGRDCPTAYGSLISRVPAASRAEEARIDVASVRRGEDDRAFVIYKTPATLSVDMPMYLEGDVWTVGALEAYALTPEQLEENRR